MNASRVDDVWQHVREGLARAPAPQPSGVDRSVYLDLAERIVRAAVPWQDDFGVIVDPYQHCHAATCTPRFVGALGQLIGAGRCLDLIEVCAKSFEYALATLTEPATSPEFALKELVLAYQGLRGRIAPERLSRWERHLRAYRSEFAFGVVRREGDNNFNTFALTGEFARIQAGLGGDSELVDRLLEKELAHLDTNGMYEDPGGPLTYHVVVVQQWAMILMLGYRGRHYDQVAQAVRRGGLSALLMQSVVGQAPFGGRSNQYHHTEAQSAALFEACARLARDDGDTILAGAFKRAARRGVALTIPWIMDMTPYRHLKQGFPPNLDHGTDSGGPYSIYGILAGSLLGIAAHLADDTIRERLTPAELGGYVFATSPQFHQVVAHCGGWSVQADLRANLEKDATGLGRVQRVGLRPEMILSGSIPAQPAYSFAFPLPQRNVAIGPEWDDRSGAVHRLADFSAEFERTDLRVIEARPEHVIFEILYEGDLGGVQRVCETHEMTPDRLEYRVRLDPVPPHARCVLPILETDGDARSSLEVLSDRITATYRGASFTVAVIGGRLRLTDERNANRNAVYRTALLAPEPPSSGVLAITLTPSPPSADTERTNAIPRDTSV